MPRLTLRTALRALLLLAALTWLPWALVAAIDLEAHSWLIPSAAAFLPYAAAATALVLPIAIAARARTAAAIALLGLATLTIPRLDRITTDDQPAARGPAITIATANVYVGESDPTALTNLIRREHVDILAIQENTPDWDARADTAGLRDLLPHRRTKPDPRPGAAGLAIWSRWPTTNTTNTPDDTRSLGALIHTPGTTPIHIRTVHPPPPLTNPATRYWRRSTHALTRTATTAPTQPILAGDWNATLDHHTLRHVLAGGYRDTAEEHGQAWRPTWTNGTWAGLTIDHILIPNDIAVRTVTAHDQPGSDHDVIISRLRLPR